MFHSGRGYTGVAEQDRVSQCDIEVVAPWRALCSLTPDATQLADPRWQPKVGGCRGGLGKLVATATRVHDRWSVDMSH